MTLAKWSFVSTVAAGILFLSLLPFAAVYAAQDPALRPGQTGTLVDPLGGNKSLPQFLAEVLRLIIRLGIPIAVLFIVWAGFKFVTAQGSDTKLAEAKKNLAYTLLGVAIFLAAALLVEIVTGTLRQFGL